MKYCPFCDIDSQKLRIIKRSKFTTVILSSPRMMAGHTLVIPKRHIEKPWQLTTEEIQAIFKDIFWVQKKLLKSLGTGCDIRQNYRPFLPQGRVKVDHVHFHVIPRTDKDELFRKSMKYEGELFKDLSPKERAKIVKLFEN